jgi:hypothetical protein
MSTQVCRISIAHELSPDLALRDIASSFMDKVESLGSPEIVIDFCEVETITRSFAHEYVTRKERSSLRINEVNVPDNVGRMFKVIQNSEKKPRFEGLRQSRTILL